MIIKVLAENTAVSETFECEHGLSLYVETEKHRLLFDTGASGLFARNAEKLGVDLAAVDIAVLSHGHYDHGGGLKTFLDQNSRAKVYVHERAFDPHYAKRRDGPPAYIGLEAELLPDERFVFCGERAQIDEELELFSAVREETPVPSGNAELYRKEGDTVLPDNFTHEQNLLIRQNGRVLLIAGCAHRGIVNIVRQVQTDSGSFPDIVIGGFHLHSRGSGQSEAPEAVDAVAQELIKTGARYYTCHCTGQEAYRRLKMAMGNQIGSLSAGSRLAINL
ncbi:MAG: MBL fold metallo-hydrolase [Lawsonibacter sp.]|nr:MBL fold metallo-hydrolase [Lawsonibacter sp.]